MGAAVRGRSKTCVTAPRQHLTHLADRRERAKCRISSERHSESHQSEIRRLVAADYRIVHIAGGGETVIHGRDGKIRDSKTVAPSRRERTPAPR
ncbi:DUF2188 domain-containing protein [Nocardioides korecus]